MDCATVAISSMLVSYSCDIFPKNYQSALSGCCGLFHDGTDHLSLLTELLIIFQCIPSIILLIWRLVTVIVMAILYYHLKVLGFLPNLLLGHLLICDWCQWWIPLRVHVSIVSFIISMILYLTLHSYLNKLLLYLAILTNISFVHVLSVEPLCADTAASGRENGGLRPWKLFINF